MEGPERPRARLGLDINGIPRVFPLMLARPCGPKKGMLWLPGGDGGRWILWNPRESLGFPRIPLNPYASAWDPRASVSQGRPKRPRIELYYKIDGVYIAFWLF